MSTPSRLSKFEDIHEPPVAPAAQGDELGYYLRLLWRSRVALLVAALVIAAAAAAWALTRERVYEANLSLGITASKLSDATDAFTTASFRPLIANHGVAASVIRDLDLRRNGEPMTTEAFITSVLRVEEVRGTSLLTIGTRLNDPQKAADAANMVAGRAVALARKLSRDEAVQVRDEIKMQLDESRERLENTRRALAGFRREAQVELVQKDVEAMLSERAGLLRLLVDIGAERAKLERAEQDLASVPRINTLLRTVDTEPGLAEVVRQRTDGTVPLDVQMRFEETNPIHQKISENAARIRERLAGLERQRVELVERRGLTAAQQAKLNELYAKESRLAQLELEVKLEERVYGEVATRYENARLQVATRSAQLSVIDPAVIPTAPLSRGVVRNAVLAFVLALGAGVVAVLLADAVRHAVANG